MNLKHAWHLLVGFVWGTIVYSLFSEVGTVSEPKVLTTGTAIGALFALAILGFYAVQAYLIVTDVD